MTSPKTISKRLLASLPVLGVLTMANIAHAQQNTASGPQSTRTPDDKWGVSLSVENDLFTKNNQDQHYTNGVRLAVWQCRASVRYRIATRRRQQLFADRHP
ncbi:lipid A-modifier LpxR family protein [Thalassospira permensis]|uniref:lipid A-modifier LpxR family protein n=1 Tax=Thalassospira permensis TaxID=680197 RepID=UPI00068E3D05|nr:lipid A-modifier LpxR family protein [Thalassospira permensis]